MARISLHIDAEHAGDLAASIVALSSALAVAGAGSIAQSESTPDPKPATRSRSTKAATSSEAQSSAAAETSGNQENNASGSAATGAASGAEDATSTVTRESVQPKATQYGQKAGVETLKDLFEKHGATTRKFSGVPEANLAALDAELTQLLAA